RLTLRTRIGTGERGLDGDRRARHACRLHPATQDLGHAPRLRNASTRRVRLDGVEDLTDRAEAEVVECRDTAIEKAPRARGILRMHLEPRVDPGADEPRPDRALMVRRVARAQVAEVARLEVRIVRRERAETDGREQTLLHDVEHGLPTRAVQHWMVQ